MKNPYNNWFYNQYKYLTGSTNGNQEYIDTKWETINNRMKRLRDINSSLLEEQPFGVIGNDRGFDQLLDLMGRSNYTFEDINDSLIDTYQYSLKHAMGRMMVNTQAIMFQTDQMDVNNVVSEEFSHYYIIDAPFNQLQFGGRDHFIREQIVKMYETGTKHWIPVQDFVKTFHGMVPNGPVSLLPFTMIATVNGFICNDFFIALSDQGMKFKIGWPYSADVTFILYKLDVADVYICETNVTNIINCLIPNTEFDARKKKPDMTNANCLINIYDKNFIKTAPSVANFGWFEETGFRISGLQKRTLTELERKQSESVTVVVYILKYFQEVQGLFPAINYVQLMDHRRVYDGEGDAIIDVNGQQVYSQSDRNNELEICTPPIILDRKNNKAFHILSKGLQLKTQLLELKSIFKNIGYQFQLQLTEKTFVDKILDPILSYRQEEGLYKQLVDCFHIYQQIAILTSMIPSVLIEKFQGLLKQIKELSELQSNQYEEAYAYNIDVFHDDAWEWFVQDITDPIMNGPLTPFEKMNELVSDYFKEVDTNYKRFNRPVSEQCLLCLRWDATEEAWLFHLPEIERFKGIGNTFYIRKGLDGTELFKFFVLYTDTENPRDTHVESLSLEQAFDFDVFLQQLDRHVGYIRYWNAENRLLKMSHILYNKYDDETITNTLSEILKNSIDGDDILTMDLSNIQYEASGITTLNHEHYDPLSEEAPFVLNYLFYTLTNLQENEDKLQSYFYHQLVMKRFHKRYFDMMIDLSSELTYPINYSKFQVIEPDVLNIQGFLMGDDSGETNNNLTLYEDNTIGEIAGDSKFIVNQYGESEDDIQVIVTRTDENDPNILSLGVITYSDDVIALTPEQVDDYWSNANFRMTELEKDNYDNLVGDNFISAYYGIPSIYKNNVVRSKGHPYVFQVFKEDQKHYMITKNDINEDRYVTPPKEDWHTISYQNDIELARRFTFYLTHIYTIFSDIQTNATKSFNQQPSIDSHIEAIEREIELLLPLCQKEYHDPHSISILNTIVYDNPIISQLKKQKKRMHAILQLKITTQRRRNRTKKFIPFINQLITNIRVIYKNYGFDDSATKRIQNLYHHLSCINTESMTCYQFKEWLTHIDVTLLDHMDQLYAKNENNDIVDGMFHEQGLIIRDYREQTIPLLDELNAETISIRDKLTFHIEPIIEECSRILTHYIFDLYVVKELPSFLDVSFRKEPYLIQAVITSRPHINFGTTRNTSTKLLFQPILDRMDDAYYIRTLVKICEYTFFYGADVEVDVHVLTIEDEILYTNKQTLTFQKIASTVDHVNDFDVLVNIRQLFSEFQNVHQDLDVHSDGMVIQSSHSQLNYELLYGNSLMLLDHTTQQSQTKESVGPYDRIEISNYKLNEFVYMEYKKRFHHSVLFKPVQLIMPSDDIQPIGQKYFVGQTLYVKTKDEKCIFPITVTAIDHHINKGFIEAEVSPRSNWFEMTEQEDIHRYLRENIACELIPDTISNFLNEFSNENYGTHFNINWDTMVRDYDEGSRIENTTTVPGDPIYVQRNAPFVYNRLNWMFHELVPNRFLDDQQKQQCFIYMGKFRSYDMDHITIKMVDHTVDALTMPEKYPILRPKPNNETVWEDEIKTFTSIRDNAILDANELLTNINQVCEQLAGNLQNNIRVELEATLERQKRMYHDKNTLRNRMQSYMDHLGTPINWHTVNSYDDALVYIQNGTAIQSHSFISDVRDIPYNEKLEVFLFDWENKIWVHPDTYDIEPIWEDHIQINQQIEYQSKHVLHRILIKPNTGFKDSKSLLVYLSYRKSNVFHGIERDVTNECNVRFKPMLSLPSRNDTFVPYKELSIRKHVSSQENYVFDVE